MQNEFEYKETENPILNKYHSELYYSDDNIDYWINTGNI